MARLHRRIEQYRLPPPVVTKLGLQSARVRPIFKDREELAAASSLSDSLQQALHDSEFLIVACSPAARGSRWVDQEIRHFREVHGADRVLAVIVGGAADEAVFPDALTATKPEEGAAPLEPLAADWRDDGDGPTAASLKLIAALVGADYDDLAQRDRALRLRTGDQAVHVEGEEPGAVVDAGRRPRAGRARWPRSANLRARGRP